MGQRSKSGGNNEVDSRLAESKLGLGSFLPYPPPPGVRRLRSENDGMQDAWTVDTVLAARPSCVPHGREVGVFKHRGNRSSPPYAQRHVIFRWTGPLEGLVGVGRKRR
ncbi:MAG: hypothetical protein JWM16_6179, partial [Verrucomicrobiales bacterium]|nr:hypothetical protein [Verrucomicrobiales bacterium]